MHYVIFKDFLKPEECEQLISLAKERQFDRSAGFDVETGQHKLSDYRTSEQTWFGLGHNELIADIEKRIAEATGTPIENGEGIQIIHYPPRTYYKAHHDYYPPGYAGSHKEIERGGQRVITFMIYLNTVPEGQGGETSFFNERVMVRPEQGKACLFFNLMPNWQVDASTMHEGLPCKEPYHKFILNKWIHERAFT